MFILPRKYPYRFCPNSKYYSSGIVFQDNGGINNERYKEDFYEDVEV